MADFNALNPTANLNNVVAMVNQVAAGHGRNIAPELFYSKQLLDTIRLDADQYPYYRVADQSPIPEKANKLQLRRWAPLQAHTVPLVEGIPPQSDKGSVETYEIPCYQYGRYMEFTDKVDFELIDPVVATYSKEYSIVAIETLDMLARDAMLTVAQTFFANQKKSIDKLTLTDKPSIADLRLIVLSMKKALVKPRSNGRFQVICSPEFVYDLITDPYVEKFMQYNQSTKTMYDSDTLVPMFNMEFYESMAAYNSGEYTNASGKKVLCLYRYNATLNSNAGGYEYTAITEDTVISGSGQNAVHVLHAGASNYVNDKRTGQPASYIPGLKTWDLTAWNALAPATGTAWASDTTNGTNGTWKELLIHHCMVVGKDALIRTGMSGQDNAKMYVKAKGSAGVLDPIDQRQSIGFKINSVGFGSARNEAITDYMCVPSTLNLT